MLKNYSVFFKDGDEANDFYLSREEAMKLARNLEAQGFEVLVAKWEDDMWKTVYETE